jgi:hypothetical protein
MKKILLLILAVVFVMSFVSRDTKEEKPQIAQKIAHKPIHRRW